MYTSDRSVDPIREGMHIHPSMSEVVERAIGNMLHPRTYHHILKNETGHHH